MSLCDVQIKKFELTYTGKKKIQIKVDQHALDLY